MQTTVDDAAAVLMTLEHAPVGALVPVDGDTATQDRVQAAFEAMAPNTRRAYGSALRTWGRWAAAQQLSGLCPPPPDLRRYLLERASEGAGASALTVFVSALRKLQALAVVEQTARDQLVADTLSGLARQAASPRQVSALTVGALAAIYETACFPRVGRGGRSRGGGDRAAPGAGRHCPLLGDVGRRPAALGSGGAGLGGHRTLGQRLRPSHGAALENRCQSAHGLSDAGCDGAPRCDPAAGGGQFGAGLRPVGGLDLAPRQGRGQGGRPGDRLQRPFRAGRDGAAHGPGRRAHA